MNEEKYSSAKVRQEETDNGTDQGNQKFKKLVFAFLLGFFFGTLLEVFGIIY